jgi:hypothetical protein
MTLSNVQPNSLSGIFLVSGESSYRILHILYDDFPRFFFSLESDLIGFCKSYKMKNAPVKELYQCRQAGIGQVRREIPAYNKPELARPR